MYEGAIPTSTLLSNSSSVAFRKSYVQSSIIAIEPFSFQLAKIIVLI